MAGVRGGDSRGDGTRKRGGGAEGFRVSRQGRLGSLGGEVGRCTGGVRVIARTKLGKDARINWYGRWVMVNFRRMTGEVERVRG